MKISPFQIILFSVFGIAALIGLFIFSTYTSSNSKESIGSVVIWGTLPKAAMSATLTTLGQTNTELRNVSYVEKDSGTLPGELASAIATGAAPDLVLDSQENLYALARFIVPIPSATLSAATFTSTFIDGSQIFASSDGYYGIPFLVDPMVLFSNRSILSSVGIARPPATWEALTGLVSRVALLTSTRQVSRGLIALGSYDNVRNARGILSTLFLQTGVSLSSYGVNGGLTGNLGVVAPGGGTPPGQAVLGFYTQFADPTKVSYTWNTSLPDSQKTFLTADLGLYIGYASEASFLRAANPNLNFIVTPVPQPATASTKSVYGLIYAFMIPNGAKNPFGGYQVAAIFSNPAEQATAAAATGLAPAALNNLAAAPNDPSRAVSYGEALYTKGWLSPAPADTDRVFSDMINSVISGRSRIESALVTAEGFIGALLGQ